MRGKAIYGTDGKKYLVRDIEKVFKIIRKYHGVILDPLSIAAMNLTLHDALMIAERLGMKIRSDSVRKTQRFTDDEVQELLPLIMLEQNMIAKLRLTELCMPLFVKSWQRHKHIDSGESMDDRYNQYISVCYLILTDYIPEYWAKKQAGSYSAKPGYKKPVDFTFVLRIRLRDAARTIEDYKKPISLGEGRARRADEVRSFIKRYEAENGGAFPSVEEIGKACRIKKPQTVRYYLDYLNIKVISGNDEERSYYSTNEDDTAETVYDHIEDVMANFDSGERFDQMVIRETVRRLGRVKSTIVFLRYGIQCDAHTDAETRELLGLSKKEYDKLLASALEELKDYFDGFSYGSG